MNADPKIAAYYAGVSQHPFDGEHPSTFVLCVAAFYAVVVLALVAKLVFSGGTPRWTAPTPFGSAATSIADICTSTASQVPESGNPDGTERNHAGANTHAATGE